MVAVMTAMAVMAALNPLQQDWLGAKVLGPPAWDPDFNSADIPMMMQIRDLPSRYRKHFLGA